MKKVANEKEEAEEEDEEEDEEDQLAVLVKAIRWRKTNIGALEALSQLKESSCFIFTPRVTFTL